MKPVRTYAEETNVPIAKSRAEIQALLTEWGCSAIGWTDHLERGRVELGFIWAHEGQDYKVRFRLEIPTRPRLEREAQALYPRRSYRAQEASSYVAYINRGLKYGAAQAHRLLLLKVKADLNAARAGLAKPEEIFLPWLVDARGVTLGEALLPRLNEVLALPESAGGDDKDAGS